ncbi:acylphosphatase [Elusimicrobiota bacterium]
MRLSLFGAVQGVGFRPFVCRLARLLLKRARAPAASDARLNFANFEVLKSTVYSLVMAR